jgi:hypothetical protein
MKKLLFMLVVNFTSFTAANAQITLAELQKMAPEKKAAYFADSLKIMLGLNEAQYSKVHDIVLEGVNKTMPVVKNNDSKMTKGFQLRDILNSQEEKLKLVLTAGQQKLYESKKKNLIAYYRKQFKESRIVLDPAGKRK